MISGAGNLPSGNGVAGKTATATTSTALAPQANAPTDATSASAGTARDPAVIVSLSPAAQAKAAADRDKARDFTLVAKDARAVLDSQYADARAKGTTITFDLAKPGVPLDLSSLSDRAVASIALNKQGEFYSDEVLWAKAELGQRIQDRLKPDIDALKSGNVSGFLKNVISQHDAMSPEVREATGWTEGVRTQTIDSLNRIQKGEKSGKSNILDFIENLQKNLKTNSRRA